MRDQLYQRDTKFGLLWRIGVHSGLRISDLLKLRPKDFKGRRLTLKEQKSSKRKTIIFDRDFVRDIRKYAADNHLRPDDYLFYRSRQWLNKHMSRQWARIVISRAAEKIGLSDIGTHSMRKIYACNIYRATGSLDAVQASLNHTKQETTLDYLRDVLGPSGDV